MPNKDEFVYKLVLTAQFDTEEKEHVYDGWTEDTKITVFTGSWLVEMTAYLEAEGVRKPVAEYRGVIEITGAPNQIYTLTLSPVKEGEGTFLWEVSFPSDLVVARMTFESLSDDEFQTQVVSFIDASGARRVEKEDKAVLPAGMYHVTFRFQKGETGIDVPPSMFVVSHVLHVFANLETGPFRLEVADGDFPKSLLEKILGSWVGGKGWDLYGNYIRGGHFGAIEIAGVNDGNLVGDPESGINFWFNRLVGKDGEKHGITTAGDLAKLVDAALIGLGMDDAFVQKYSNGKRRAVPEAVKTFAANGNEPELIWSMEGNNSVLTVKLADYVLPPVKFNGPMYDFEIRFDGNLGSGQLAPIFGFDGEAVTLPNKTAASAFARQWWWEPAGWNLQKGGDDQSANFPLGGSFRPSAPEDFVTLYVAWGRGDATLKFDLNGQPGTPPQDKTGKLGSGIPLPSVANGTLFKFLGWAEVKTGSEYVEAAGSPHLLTESRTMYAVWQEHPQNNPPAMVSVTFNANYGSQDPVEVQTKAGIVIELPTADGFKRDGYNFVGWSPVPSGGKVFPSQSYFKLGDANAAFYAQWTAWKPVPFRTITLNSNDGTGRSAKLEPVPEGTVISLPLAGFTWEFRDFVGWHKSAIGVGNGQPPKPDYVPGADYTVNADSTLYEAWFRERFTVSFESEYLPSNFSSIDALKGDSVTLHASVDYTDDYTGKDWKLVGWRQGTDENGHSYTPGESFTPAASIALSAVWLDVSVPSIKVTGPSSMDRGGTAIFTASLGGGITHSDVKWEIVSAVIAEDETTLDGSQGSTNRTSIGTLTVGHGEGGEGSDLMDFGTDGTLTIRAYYLADPAIKGEVTVTLKGRREAGEWQMV
ncbi:MAG: InlB B-repeat-containing protein, partial [Treponema sp.]|nr:InlB B-repeat-containing protein [Treponema sp.]